MTEPSNLVLHVAAAYGFEVKFVEPLDKWIIKAKLSPGWSGVEFYWDSTYNEQDFFDELRSTFNQEGVEKQITY
jgi:hypothetical protein